MNPRRHRARRAALPLGTTGLLRRALQEDRWRQDITTQAIVRSRLSGRALIAAQASGVLSGLEAARRLAQIGGLRSATRTADGRAVRAGTVVLELRGDVRRILAVERTLLNLLMHLSGVATLTAEVVHRARRVRPGFRIRATRKTLPGLRDLEKAAVVDGGGEPHRRDLSDAVLIKSTHLSLVPLTEAVQRARSALGSSRRLQVEIRSATDARAAVAAGARRLLVDNQSPVTVARIVRDLRQRTGGAPVEVEVSGGIGPKTIAAYARTGADAASLGQLTHSAPAVPFHLTLVAPPRRRAG